MEEKIYLTTPIYYANERPHIGHAYTTIAADALARYYRWQAKRVFFSMGTDEHGLKIQETALRLGKSPASFCDEIAKEFIKTWKLLDISYDRFIRTTDPWHENAVKEFLKILYQKGFIYKGKYKGLYCVGCEQFKSKSDLVGGKCPEHNKEPEVRKEEAYLFKLSYFQKDLIKLFENNKLEIEPPTRRREIVSFLKKQRLHDLSISRPREKVSWGIELPFDRAFTCYVWVDAFLNYLSVLGWPKQKENFNKFWPPDIQLMGKDILRIHATLWPALLLAAGYRLPRKFFCHGYFTIDGQKMSKTLGNFITPLEVVKKYNVDTLRYFLLREISFGRDGDFSLAKLKQRYEADLVNDLGNLVHRVAVMIDKYLGGKIPLLEIKKEKVDLAKIKKASLLASKEIKKFDQLINNFRFDEALIWIWQRVKKANQLVDSSKPWILAKENSPDLEKVLFHLTDSLLDIAWFLLPFMPQTAEKIINLYQGPKIKEIKPLFPK